MRHKGATFNHVWSNCQRCGFQYPINMLVNQLGLRVCTLYCYDNLDINYRPFMIEQVLSDDSEELVPQTPKIDWNPEEIVF